MWTQREMGQPGLRHKWVKPQTTVKPLTTVLSLMLKETPPEVYNRKGHSPRIPRKIDNLSDHRLHPPVLIHEPLLEITLDKNCFRKTKDNPEVRGVRC